jgi:uncharacterized protein (DUF2384 family)
MGQSETVRGGKRGSTAPTRQKRRRAEAPSKEIHPFSSSSTLILGERQISMKSIAEHALETFGSKEKSQHWMNRPNPLFHGQTPSQVMRTDPVLVEAELVRIDHGVYV